MMRYIKYIYLALLLGTAVASFSQEARLPTESEKMQLAKNFQVILKEVPGQFARLRTEDSLDFFGTMAYGSSVRLFPLPPGSVAQTIFYMTEPSGQSVKSYTELLPVPLTSVMEVLTPLFKQYGLTEVVPQRADSTKITRSFRSKQAVVEIVAATPSSPAIIVIGRPYYYYAGTVKPVPPSAKTPPAVKKPVGETSGKAPAKTSAGSNTEEKMRKTLVLLYKSAVNKAGSFSEFRTGVPDTIERTMIYSLTSQLSLDSLQKASLFVANAGSGILGVSIDLLAATTPACIAALKKMAAAGETAGEWRSEKKTGLTRYALYSASLKTEVLSLLDFELPEYPDRLIFPSLYTGPELQTGNGKGAGGTSPDGVYKNYRALPPADTALLNLDIKLGFSLLIQSQLNLDGSFSDLRKGTPVKNNTEDVYDVTGLTDLPNLAAAQLFVPTSSQGTRGLVLNIDPLITGFYVRALYGITKAEGSGQEMGTVSTEKGTDGKTTYAFTSSIIGSRQIIIIDHADPKAKDDVLFLSVY